MIIVKEKDYDCTFIGVFENKEEAIKKFNYFDPDFDINEYYLEEFQLNSFEEHWSKNKCVDLLFYYFPITEYFQGKCGERFKNFNDLKSLDGKKLMIFLIRKVFMIQNYSLNLKIENGNTNEQ